MSNLILSIDQGTTGSTVLVIEAQKGRWRTLGRATTDFPQHFPHPGWVSHDPEEIWGSVLSSISEALRAAAVRGDGISAIGITNQRETTILWDRATGRPIDLAIVWQCRRTADVCAELSNDPATVDRVKQKTGLVIDAYFSATKIAWLLDHVEGARARADRGELAFGTVDSFLVHRLTGGAVHVTDVSNASRTLLMDLSTLRWDPDLASLFRVPTSVLPQIVGNAEVVGRTSAVGPLPAGIPICGMAGDQQAALFGQACFREGDAKCTFGTGAFALMNIGKRPILSGHGLVTTIGWRIDGETVFALEGSAFIAGAAIQWLRDGLGIIRRAEEVNELAARVASSDGVVFVPALAGLGAPYWDAGARGLVSGITRGTTAAHIARATLEGIAFTVRDLLVSMAEDAGRALSVLRVDGGAAKSDLLMQIQADIANVDVERPVDVESTARGAAMLAARGAGVLASTDEASAMVEIESTFTPKMAEADRQAHIARYSEALARSRSSKR